MIARIDPVGRVAYGMLCIAGMAALALPLLVVVGSAVAVYHAVDGNGDRAAAAWLLSWGCALFAGALFLAIFYTAWPLASDWIMEWPGYAAGFSVAGAYLALMALLLFLPEVPVYAAVALPLAGAFATGFAIAGRLAGLKAPAARPRERVRTLRRR